MAALTSTSLPSALLSTRGEAATSSVIRDLLAIIGRPGMLSLAGGLPAPELLPVARIADAAQRVLGVHADRALQYAPTEGAPELRRLVAPDRPDDVIVTTGSQQGLDLLARTLCDAHDVVLVESPAYLGALQAFQAAGADVVAIPSDHDGLDVDALETALDALAAAGRRPKFVYVVANFQNPSGATLSRSRRRQLLDVVARENLVVVEDDPYGALRFRGEAIPDLRELAATTATAVERVVSLGTVSKIVSPGLRVGWMVTPLWLHGPLVRAKQATDLHTSPLTQLIAADVLADAAFLIAHVDRLRTTYRHRAETLLAALSTELGDVLAMDPVDGGMFCWGRLVDGGSTAARLPAALDAGVAFVPGDAFSLDDRNRSHLRLCFTTLDDDELAEAARRLGAVLR